MACGWLISCALQYQEISCSLTHANAQQSWPEMSGTCRGRCDHCQHLNVDAKTEAEDHGPLCTDRGGHGSAGRHVPPAPRAKGTGQSRKAWLTFALWFWEISVNSAKLKDGTKTSTRRTTTSNNTTKKMKAMEREKKNINDREVKISPHRVSTDRSFDCKSGRADNGGDPACG